MGLSNITNNLEKQIAQYCGERDEKAQRIERIEKLVADLPALQERIHKLDHLISAAELLLKERNPDWSPDQVKPIRRNEYKSPIPLGAGSRMALDILRTATKPLTTREIAEEMLARVGVVDPDRATREKVQSNVDVALRHREGAVVKGDGGWPQRWCVAVASGSTVSAK